MPFSAADEKGGEGGLVAEVAARVIGVGIGLGSVIGRGVGCGCSGTG
jgi:hypothetical protein